MIPTKADVFPRSCSLYDVVGGTNKKKKKTKNKKKKGAPRQPPLPAQPVPIAKELADFFKEVHGGVYEDRAMVPIGKLLWDLATKSAVCNILRPTDECYGLLSQLLSPEELGGEGVGGATPTGEEGAAQSRGETYGSGPEVADTGDGGQEVGVAGMGSGGQASEMIASEGAEQAGGGQASGEGGAGAATEVAGEGGGGSGGKVAERWKQKYTSANREKLYSFRGQSLLAQVLDVYRSDVSPELPQSFWPFVTYLMENCMRAFPDEPILHKWKDLPLATDIKNEEEMAHYQTNGMIYPGRPRQRPRGCCHHDSSGAKEGANSCTHVFVGHRKKTGGLMASFCPHSVCLGCHIIVNAEGRKDAFRFLFTRLEEAPKVVIYVCFPFQAAGYGGLEVIAPGMQLMAWECACDTA